MLVVIKKYWKLKIIDLMWSTLPSGIFFQTISTWSSLSGRLCSCQNPRACPTHTQKKIQKQCSLACNLFFIHDRCHSPISWTTVPWYQQPLASEICCFPPWRPTYDQHLRKTKTSAMTKKKKRTLAILLTRLILNYNQYVVLHILGVYQNFSFRSQGSPSLFPRITIPRCFVYILWKQKQTT